MARPPDIPFPISEDTSEDMPGYGGGRGLTSSGSRVPPSYVRHLPSDSGALEVGLPGGLGNQGPLFLDGRGPPLPRFHSDEGSQPPAT